MLVVIVCETTNTPSRVARSEVRKETGYLTCFFLSEIQKEPGYLTCCHLFVIFKKSERHSYCVLLFVIVSLYFLLIRKETGDLTCFRLSDIHTETGYLTCFHLLHDACMMLE